MNIRILLREVKELRERMDGAETTLIETNECTAELMEGFGEDAPCVLWHMQTSLAAHRELYQTAKTAMSNLEWALETLIAQDPSKVVDLLP